MFDGGLAPSVHHHRPPGQPCLEDHQAERLPRRGGDEELAGPQGPPLDRFGPPPGDEHVVVAGELLVDRAEEDEARRPRTASAVPAPQVGQCVGALVALDPPEAQDEGFVGPETEFGARRGRVTVPLGHAVADDAGRKVGDGEGALDQGPLGVGVEGEAADGQEDVAHDGQMELGLVVGGAVEDHPATEPGGAVHRRPEEIRRDGDEIAVGRLGLVEHVRADRPDQLDEATGHVVGDSAGSSRMTAFNSSVPRDRGPKPNGGGGW